MRTYQIELWTPAGKEKDYGGGYTAADIRTITRGWKIDNEFTNSRETIYTRRGSKKVFFVTEERGFLK